MYTIYVFKVIQDQSKKNNKNPFPSLHRKVDLFHFKQNGLKSESFHEGKKIWKRTLTAIGQPYSLWEYLVYSEEENTWTILHHYALKNSESEPVLQPEPNVQIVPETSVLEYPIPDDALIEQWPITMDAVEETLQLIDNQQVIGKRKRTPVHGENIEAAVNFLDEQMEFELPNEEYTIQQEHTEAMNIVQDTAEDDGKYEATNGYGINF